jgi:hypothetical protein
MDKDAAEQKQPPPLGTTWWSSTKYNTCVWQALSAGLLLGAVNYFYLLPRSTPGALFACALTYSTYWFGCNRAFGLQQEKAHRFIVIQNSLGNQQQEGQQQENAQKSQ